MDAKINVFHTFPKKAELLETICFTNIKRGSGHAKNDGKPTKILFKIDAGENGAKRK